MKRTLLYLSRLNAVIALAILPLSLAAPPASGADSDVIQAKVAQYLKKPGIRATTWGIEVVDPSTHEVLLSVNPEKPFLPASVLKVVTTAAALEKLGPDFRFRTGAYTNGTLTEDGTLDGDLYLYGRGDPNLTDPEGLLLEKPALQQLAEKLEALGIRKIEGDIIGDDSYFDTRRHGQGWTAKDLRSFYGAPISALSHGNNIVWVHARATKPGQAVRVSIEPATAYYSVRNLAVTSQAKSKRTIHARVTPGTKRLAVSGVLPVSQGYSQYLVIERPAEFTAALLREELKRKGIAVKGSAREVHYGTYSEEVRSAWTLLVEHQSSPLIRALEIINKKSENLHAEMLLRVLGAEFRGLGTDEAGLQVVRDFLVEAQVDDEKVSLRDGSGLSRENLLTPHFQTSLLLALSKRPYFDLFINTLAISGVDGTLKNRMSARDVKGVIYAKTGTLNGVATLSGYMTTRSGRSLIFSIFANNARTSMTRIRKAIDEICSLLVSLY